MIEVMGVFNDGAMVPGTHEALHPPDDGTPMADLVERLRSCAVPESRRRESFIWVALFHPTRPELQVVGEVFGLPRLQLEDAANPRQRPKVEFDSARAFVVFKLLDYVQLTNDIETGQMSVFVGPGYVVTVRDGATGNLRWVIDRLATPKGAEHGPLTVLHAVLDQAVDDYLRVVDEISSDVTEIEESVFAPVRTDDTAIFTN